jgi:hypothetical protein
VIDRRNVYTVSPVMADARAPRWVLETLQPFLEQDFGSGWSTALREWRFESRYFSSLILFTTRGESSSPHRYLAKLPKAERGRGLNQVPERVPADLDLAQQEYTALVELAKTWPRGDVSYVEPRFFDATRGMLVFDYLEGQDLYTRQLPLSLVFRAPSNPVLSGLRRVGSALALYHARTTIAAQFDYARVLAKIEQRSQALGVRLPGSLASIARGHSSIVVPGIKGFEFRNARIGADRIWFFDPGRLRQEPAEADVARFLVSLRLCGWGTPYFSLPIRTGALVEAFIHAYRNGHPLNEQALDLFILKEVLWNWREFRDVLATKTALPVFSALMTKLYLDYPFRRLWRDSIGRHAST